MRISDWSSDVCSSDLLTFAVLDRDQTMTSRDYTLNIAGSRYFIEQAPITNYVDLDRRMRAGELSLAIEIPPGFARDLARGRPLQIGAWIDGAIPSRPQHVPGHGEGMTSHGPGKKESSDSGRDTSGGLDNTKPPLTTQ